MIISLAGYMGSGKSLVAKNLSQKLNFKLIDLDKEISASLNAKITEIFEKKGEIFFRRKEREVLEQILATEKNAILSLGGGTPAYYNNMEVINDRSESIFLKANIKTLTERLIPNKQKRPLISKIEDGDLPEFIAKHLFERLPYYNKSKYSVSTDNKSVTEITDEIIQLLPAHLLHQEN